MDSKKILPIAIIIAAVLVVVAVYALRTPATNQTALTSPQANSNGQIPSTSGQTGQTGQTGAPAAVTPQIPDKPVSSKDPATLVPDGTNLKQYCEKYYTAWKASDWQTAYTMQPLAKQQQKDVNSFSQGLQGYGLVTYQVGEPQINGNIGTVLVELDLGQNGGWSTNWTFVKNDKGQWTVYDSKTGMSQ